jgi:hypothetical protein
MWQCNFLYAAHEPYPRAQCLTAVFVATIDCLFIGLLKSPPAPYVMVEIPMKVELEVKRHKARASGWGTTSAIGDENRFF